ncbi:ribonuclease P protein component [Roseiarcus fermentans]|uniref:Ribonuclease P protein component n=1 Tax=Roseiarcus fermentans TaxID=1473586 RepID=A0A366EVQ2_9HYPH|nr:ribonuclease P protein component [Roseiarcus fermentans]RBP06473.1 ribonuclease P protein component [Roseiarcus fermentans]
MEPNPQDQDAAASLGRDLGRLKRRAEFQRVSRGRRRTFDAFTLQGAERPGDALPEAARVGFTVTKKVGNAVVRNRIRRRLKAALAGAGPLAARADCDYVLVARREALARPFAALVDDLRRAFRAVGRNDKDGRRSAAATPPKGKIRRP